MTALMLATNKGHLDLVQALLNGGADINKKQPVSFIQDNPVLALSHVYFCSHNSQLNGLPSSLLPGSVIRMYSKSCSTEEPTQRFHTWVY